MKIIKILFPYLVGIALSFSLLSCANEEGVGGTASVQGKVYKILMPKGNFDFTLTGVVEETDSFKIESYIYNDVDTVPAAKEKVYIVYGDSPIYGDRMDIGYDGMYKFDYLVKGKYVIYSYSEGNSIKDAVSDTVYVEKGETKVVPDMYVYDGKAIDNSFVAGTLHVRDYGKDKIVTGYGNGVRMYIRKVGTNYHFDDVRTSIDGKFIFENLSPGTYEVYTFTEEDGFKSQRIKNDANHTCIQKVVVPQLGTITTIKKPFKITLNS